MTRRSNDLLSIFDANQQAQRKAQVSAAARARSTGRAAERASSRGAGGAGRGRGFQGLWLSPRQVVLAGCVGTLLFLLTFFVGLAMGRPGADGGQGTSLRRDAGSTPTGGVLLQLSIPSMDGATGRRIEGDQIRSRLAELGLDSRFIRTIREDAGAWIVHAGPFASAAAVDEWIRAKNLAGVQVAGSTPFHRREYVELSGR